MPTGAVSMTASKRTRASTSRRASSSAARKVDDGVALDVRKKQRAADLEDCARQTFADAIGMALEVVPEMFGLRGARESDEVESARRRVIEVDADRATDRFRDAARGVA